MNMNRQNSPTVGYTINYGNVKAIFTWLWGSHDKKIQKIKNGYAGLIPSLYDSILQMTGFSVCTSIVELVVSYD